MPQFDVGSRAVFDKVQERAALHPGLYLAGSLTGAFGIPDCIRSGELAAERLTAGSGAWVANQANQKA